MANKNNGKKAEATPETKAAEAEVNNTAAQEEAEAKTKAELIETKAALEKAEAELAAANDKYLRLAAEYDNYRKRTQKEHAELYTTAFADAVTMLLPVIDNLDRAVGFATDDSELAKGILMLKKQTDEALAKMRVEEIASDGEQFDPELHNAIMHEEDENSPENTVSATLQKGYKIGDKVIRFALVKVVN